MKKLLALLLAIVMIFALCACGNNDDDDEDDDKKGSQVQDEDEGIVGKWVGEIDFAEQLEARFEAMELEEELLDLFVPDELAVTIIFEFDDENISMTLEAEDAFEDYIDQVIENMVEYFEDSLDDEGYTVEEFEEEVGMGLEEYVEGQVTGLIGNMTLSDSTAEAEYVMDGNKISFDDSYMVIDLDGNEFTIEEVSSSSVEFLVGVTFERE